MAADFYIKQGDLLPEIQVTCTDADTGDAIDLTAATAVRFHMRKPGASTEKVDAAATFVDKALGQVKYSWTGSDTDETGEFDAEFEVTFGAGTLTFPNWKQLIVKITGDVS